MVVGTGQPSKLDIKRKMKPPIEIQVELVTACNLECEVCPRTIALRHAKNSKARQAWNRLFPFEKFEELVNQFRELSTVTLHGIGEPLLHPKLSSFVAKASSVGANVRLTTNATLLTNERAEALASAGLGRMVVSLDGTTAQTHERVRAGSNFDETISNIRGAMKIWSSFSERPRLEIAMVVSRINEHEATAMPEFASQLGADAVSFSPMKPPIQAVEKLVTSRKNWSRLRTELQAKERQVGIPVFIRGEPSEDDKPYAAGTHRCKKPWNSSVILMNGNVMPCCNIHDSQYSLGNAFDDEFMEVWQGDGYSKFRAKLAKEDLVPKACKWCPEFR